MTADSKMSDTLLYGMEMEGLETDLSPLSAFCLIKGKEKDGVTEWFVRNAGEEINSEELLGSLESYVEYLREDIASNWKWGDESGDGRNKGDVQ